MREINADQEGCGSTPITQQNRLEKESRQDTKRRRDLLKRMVQPPKGRP